MDDDDSLRRALARAVRRAGHEVEAFASVEALLARGMPEQGACLVLDLDLPGADGAELKQALESRRTGLPTIYTTAFEADQVGSARGGETRELLCKPFDHRALLDAIGRACRRQEEEA